MTDRVATCRCGQLRVECTGDPVRVSICHCLNCQRRSGSSFAAQARWPEDQVAVTGAFNQWSTVGESGARATFRFCPECGSTVFYSSEGMPGLIAVAIGAFADPDFPPPSYSVYEGRKHRWVAVIGDDIDHFD